MKGICCKCKKNNNVLFYKSEGKVVINICRKCLEKEKCEEEDKKLIDGFHKVKELQRKEKELQNEIDKVRQEKEQLEEDFVNLIR